MMLKCTHCNQVFQEREVLKVDCYLGVTIYSHGDWLNWDCYVKTLRQIAERQIEECLEK